MKTTNKKGLSYFRLKLESYLSEHFPEEMEDRPLITARTNEAPATYCDTVEEEFSHLEAESMVNEVLYHDLHFSKYDMPASALENEFEKELPSPLPERLVPILLKNRVIQGIFDKHSLMDELVVTPEYNTPYTELTGAVVLLIEANQLSMVGDVSALRQTTQLIPIS